MRVAIEEFILINFLMDFLFLYLASRGTWFFSLKRLLWASLLGSIYSLIALINRLPPFFHSLSFALMTLTAFPIRDKGLFLRTVFIAFTGLFVLGSAVRLSLKNGGGTLLMGIIGAGAGAVLVSVMKAAFEKTGNERQAYFFVRLGESFSEFSAIIDTGNLLKEPLSALPVLIADEQALGKSFLSRAQKEKNARQAAYASIGGDGKMMLIRADEIRVNVSGRWVHAPDMWIGIYPGRMRGGVHALAPPVVSIKNRGKSKGTEGEL